MSHPKPWRPRPRRAPSIIPGLLIGGGVIVLGLVGWLAWRGATAAPVKPEVTGAPRLKVDREKIDLGDVKLGQTVEVTFQLTNVGDQTLRLTEAPYVEVVDGC